MKARWFVLTILLVQAACAFFFVSDIVSSVLGLRTTAISWHNRELIEIGAAVGLILGLILGAIALYRSSRAQAAAEEGLRRAQTAFMELLTERFAEWGLTPAEADVALFAIKGLNTADIAGLRQTSEGTVKAQTAAIYRKAGVTGRPQLLSLFIDDLMRDDASPRSAAEAPVPRVARA